ncbi:hypothetical protein [Streptomyces prunicolor]|uniref:hypothetical protein n=1 Tax=Streptomyces prunicolor TaxID=67348 RepID=UPI0034410422
MAVTVPTTDDVQALYAFLYARADEEWEAINSDDTLDPDTAARFYRVSNSNKRAITSTRECLVDLLNRGDDEQAARAWHCLTGAGEEWMHHPGFLPVWENPQMARVRQMIAGG